MSTEASLQRQYIMPCITSHITKRTFVVLSRRLQQQLERFFAQQGTEFALDEMPYPYTEPEDYERLERVFRHLSAAVGIPQIEGESIIHILEAAAMRLKDAGFPTADEEAAI